MHAEQKTELYELSGRKERLNTREIYVEAEVDSNTYGASEGAGDLKEYQINARNKECVH